MTFHFYFIFFHLQKPFFIFMGIYNLFFFLIFFFVALLPRFGVAERNRYDTKLYLKKKIVLMKVGYYCRVYKNYCNINIVIKIII